MRVRQMVDWTEKQLGRLTEHTATIGDYELSIVGDGAGWIWTIRRQSRIEFQGVEKNLGGATRTIKTIVQRMQEGSDKA